MSEKPSQPVTDVSAHKRLPWLGWIRRHQPMQIALADQMIVSGVNFLTGILLARFLGLEEFGRFSLIWMAVLFAQSLQLALVISPMMSFGPKIVDEEESAYYGSAFAQQIILSVLFAVLSYTGVMFCESFFPQWKLLGTALPLSLTILFCQLQEWVRRYFFTRHQSGLAILNDGVSYLGQLLAILLAFLFLAKKYVVETPEVLWLVAATSALAFGIGLVSLGKLSFSNTGWKKNLICHWQFSKWLLASTLLQWASGNFFLITAGGVLGAAATGILKACQNILGLTHILFNAMGNRVPVDASRFLAREGEQRVKLYLKKSTFVGGVATFILCMPAILFPEITLKWVYGSEFSGYEWILRWYALVYFVMFLIQMLTFALRTFEDTRPIFVGYLITGLFGLSSAWPIVTNFGLTGVMSGLLIMVVINLLTLLVSYFLRLRQGVSAPLSGSR